MNAPNEASLGLCRLALALQHQHREKGKAGTADHHQMRRTPKGDVLPENPMPDVVEREPDHRVHPAAGHQHAAHRRVPVTRDAHRRRPGFAERQHDRQHAPDEDPEQPDDDEVVRRVGQRARVAAITDMPADVPDEAEQGADDRRGEHQHRQRYPVRAVELNAQPISDPGQPLDAMSAVRMAHPQHRQGYHHRGDREPDHLVQPRAARRRLGNKRQFRRLHRYASQPRPAAPGDLIR